MPLRQLHVPLSCPNGSCYDVQRFGLLAPRAKHQTARPDRGASREGAQIHMCVFFLGGGGETKCAWQQQGTNRSSEVPLPTPHLGVYPPSASWRGGRDKPFLNSKGRRREIASVEGAAMSRGRWLDRPSHLFVRRPGASFLADAQNASAQKPSAFGGDCTKPVIGYSTRRVNLAALPVLGTFAARNARSRAMGRKRTHQCGPENGSCIQTNL